MATPEPSLLYKIEDSTKSILSCGSYITKAGKLSNLFVMLTLKLKGGSPGLPPHNPISSDICPLPSAHCNLNTEHLTLTTNCGALRDAPSATLIFAKVAFKKYLIIPRNIVARYNQIGVVRRIPCTAAPYNYFVVNFQAF